jgi:hypothetical protein
MMYRTRAALGRFADRARRWYAGLETAAPGDPEKRKDAR